MIQGGQADAERKGRILSGKGFTGSPVEFGYRNKMEFSFGDEYKDGPLALGLHKKGSTYDVSEVPDDCRPVT